MRKKLKSALLLCVALMLIISTAPDVSYSDDSVYYIKNNYTTGAYLYEANGVLRYGIPVAGDAQFQWQLEDKSEGKIIRNVATNHCITLEGHADETVEGYWGDSVACLDYIDGNDTFLWSCSIDKAQNILSASVKYDQYALHLENVTNGQVASQKLSDDQLNWGNMKWDFVKEKDINFAALTREGFCIQNVEDGSYLRVDNDQLTYGVPSGADNAYIWFFEQQADGSKAIRNKLTSQYISLVNYDKTSLTLGCSDFAPGDGKLLWNVQVSKETPILSASPDYAGFGLYADASADNKVKSDAIVSQEGYPKSKMKWNIVSATEVPGVVGPLVLEEGVYMLKNSWYAMYMIEDNGVPVYGNARPTDTYAQWRILYDEASGLTALKNEGTGHYMHLNSSKQLVCDATETYYWKLNRNKNLSYPNAVEFQDSTDPKSFVHMESLSGLIENSGAVQPNWGTPHWEPIKVDPTGNLGSEADSFKIPSGFIRIQSSALPGQYLYENASGALVYGDVKATDARSHWEILESKTPGSYLIKNKQYENLVTNKGNGTLRCLEEEKVTGEGSLWQITSIDGGKAMLFNGADSSLAAYKRPYLNIQRQSGFAQCGLVSAEEATTQWIAETAQESVAAGEEAQENPVPISAFTDTNLYKISFNGEPLSSTYKLEYYGSRIRVLDTSNNQYLYYDNGFKTKTISSNQDLLVQWENDSKAGIFGLKKEKIKLQLEAIPSDAFYSADDAYANGDEKVFAVYAQEAGAYQVEIGYSGTNITAALAVNGISQGDISLPMKDKISLALNKGINTLSLTKAKDISGITLFNSINKSWRGASAAYIEYEAEDCDTNGTLIEDDRTYRTQSSEASGRFAVNLDGTGQNIKITLTKPANALVLRYSIPDSQDGKGLDETLNLYINGIKSKGIPLASKYSWVYGAYPWTNNPKDGQAHHFYDETRVLLDKTYPAGTVIKLQKDAANHADYYIIDLVETHEISVANQMPANALSIADFGAVPNDGADDTKALTDCINASLEQGKEVWIPGGVFDLGTSTKDFDAGDNSEKSRGILLTKDNVTIRGAGMWHTLLQGDYAAFFIKANNISLYDFSLSGSAVARRDAIDPSAIETDYNTPEMKNVTLQNLWIEHYKTGIWTHNLSGLHVVGCRIHNTFADGMNLRRGTSNSVVEQCDIKNTGDDAIALWSSDYSDTNDRIRFNTVSLQWLANNIALYGGTDIEVTDNVIKDTVGMGGGVNISSNFNPKPFGGSITVSRNTLIRCGSFNSNYNLNSGAIWFNTVPGNDNHANVLVKDNLLMDSTFQGISFSNKGKVDQVILEGNVMDGCGSMGIDIAAGSRGAATARNNVIRNAMLQEIGNSAEDAFMLTVETTEDKSPVSQQGATQSKSDDIVIYIVVAVVIIMAISLALVLYLKRKGHASK